jgi:hypothetical protein
MTISWSTSTAYTADEGPMFVKYGLTADNLNLIAHGNSVKYMESVHHHVTTASLNVGATYYYVAGVASALSPVATFKAPPSPYGKIQVAVYGDMGIDNSNATMELLEKRRVGGAYDLFLHIGDIAYGDDKGLRMGANKYYEPTYDQFMTSVEEFAGPTPYMVGPGNHDVTCHDITDFGCQDGLRNFQALNGRFKMPSEESGGAKNMWYSFDFGPVHFISISTETDYPGAATTPDTWFFGGAGGGFGDQVAWLKADLAKANANRAQRPWIIATGHRPMYDKTVADWPLLTQEHLRTAFEDIFIDGGVDLYIAGHIHAYERNYPLIHGEANPNGITHITAGAPGNQEKIDPRGLLVHKYTAYCNYQTYGWGELVVHNATHLDWNYYRSTDGGLDDTVTIVNRSEKPLYDSSTRVTDY